MTIIQFKLSYVTLVYQIIALLSFYLIILTNMHIVYPIKFFLAFHFFFLSQSVHLLQSEKDLYLVFDNFRTITIQSFLILNLIMATCKFIYIR